MGISTGARRQSTAKPVHDAALLLNKVPVDKVEWVASEVTDGVVVNSVFFVHVNLRARAKHGYHSRVGDDFASLGTAARTGRVRKIAGASIIAAPHPVFPRRVEGDVVAGGAVELSPRLGGKEKEGEHNKEATVHHFECS